MLLIFKSLKIMSLQPLRWFAFNGIFANFSNGLTYIAMTWIILSEKNSISALAILMICFWGPTVFLGPLCGVIADHYPRKNILILSNASRGLFLLGLVIIEKITHRQIYITALFLSIMGNLYGPAAFAYIREIVPTDKMFQANTIVALSYEIGNVVGMGCAGLLMSLYPTRMVVFTSGVLFLISALCLTVIKTTPAIPIHQIQRIKHSIFKSMKEGLMYIFKVKNIRVLYTVQLFLMINFLTSPILLAPFAKNILQANTSQFGAIQACLSLGIITGGLISPWLLEIWQLRKIVILKTTAIMLLFLLFSITSNIFIAKIIHFCLGFSLVAWTLVITQAQLGTEINYQARAQSAFNSIAASIILLIYIVLHLGGDLISLRALYVSEALFAGIAAYLLWRNQDFLK